jgi:site-specific DNA-methyltransferase (cytosine-N4-specific)
LGIAKEFIYSIKDEAIRNFFKVAFSETVRGVSYVKLGEFKLVRSKNISANDNADVFSILLSKLMRNKKGLFEFEKACANNAKAEVYNFNTVNNIPDDIISPCSVDMVLTSPPYGDSRTTVAYGQYSRLANEWLNYSAASQIDNLLMGGKKMNYHYEFKSQIINSTIEKIKLQDSNRVKDVISFFVDYEKSINIVSKTIKKNGYACYVVGNRTVKGVNIPTDEITAELFKQNGFNHLKTIVRNIPNKRMPLRNSPSNIVGKTASTMKNEFIVICKKN